MINVSFLMNGYDASWQRADIVIILGVRIVNSLDFKDKR